MKKDLLILMILFWIGYSVNESKTMQPKTKIELVQNKVQPTKHSKKKQTKKSDNKPKIITHVTLTCYHPVATQCNADFLHTADNSEIDLKKLKAGDIKWVAISQDLIWMIPMGSKVRITDEASGMCYGTYIVKDKMNKRWEHRMDILMHPSSTEKIYAENIKIEVV